MMVGCLLFEPASTHGTFALFLSALFVLAAGLPRPGGRQPADLHAGSAGDGQQPTHFRQASIRSARHCSPMWGLPSFWDPLQRSIRGRSPAARSTSFERPRPGGGAHLSCACRRDRSAGSRGLAAPSRIGEPPVQRVSVLRSFDLLSRPRFALRRVVHFLYVGGEVAIGSVIVNYLMHRACWESAPSRRASMCRSIGEAPCRPIHRGVRIAHRPRGDGSRRRRDQRDRADRDFRRHHRAAIGLLAPPIGLFNLTVSPIHPCERRTRQADRRGFRTHLHAIVGGAVVPIFTGQAAAFGPEVGARGSGHLLRRHRAVRGWAHRQRRA